MTTNPNSAESEHPASAAFSPSDFSDTPECDNEAFVATYDYWESCDVVRLQFAERLERERNSARTEAERWRRVAAQYAGCKEEHCNRLPWEPSWDEHQRAIKARARSLIQENSVLSEPEPE